MAKICEKLYKEAGDKWNVAELTGKDQIQKWLDERKKARADRAAERKAFSEGGILIYLRCYKTRGDSTVNSGWPIECDVIHEQNIICTELK